MTLSLYLDTERWRAHQRAVLADFPGLVPVAKGNGYGLGNRRLAEEAALLGTGLLAVGTAEEAAEVLAHGYPGQVLVLTPYRIGEPAPAPAPPEDRVLRTAGSLEAVRALAGRPTVVECMTSMRRHGISPADLVHLAGPGSPHRFALHLPLDRRAGRDPVAEVDTWVRAIGAAGLTPRTVFLSHLGAAELAELTVRHPGTAFRCRIGTRLWLGDVGALTAAATVLDVTAVRRGERYGYRQHRAPGPGHLLVLSGGTAHGVGMEAPKYLHGLLPRLKTIARAGLATVNRSLSPYQWQGRQLWFAEPPHMQVSIVFLPAGPKPPAVGDELTVTVRHTTTRFDRVVDRQTGSAAGAVPGSPAEAPAPAGSGDPGSASSAA
ncbi:alanine racemase [Streptomyces tateyamensis]|uniref:Alanine racemase n=1 Tax=Streptomyces tateyamensis TaxID=565073 RepID=A0A2V4NZ73_9ACTN|nr:alanine racemase [Streptomyces tateyamensis]PYC87516.1 alanine racemase [Streptomyces tateyamensis]